MRGNSGPTGREGVTLPKQNRPLVRDGRLQARKKRTDRSYLRPGLAPAPELAAVEEAAAEEPAVDVVAETPVAPAAEPATRATAPAPARPAASGKLPTAVRAIQQQGIRKRREVDLHALARRDSQYAIHELRRIFILTAMVVTTLIVLGFILR